MELSQIFMALSALLKIVMVYFVVVACRWILKRRRSYPSAAPKTRFAVVVAARNEEAVIGRLVKSLLEQDYPRELFDVFVVPNNCTDQTAQAAFQAGAEILHCSGPVRHKGDALRQSFAQLMEEGYDAFAVFDADNVADRNYLKKTNDAICAGARVVKGRQVAGNARDSWVAGCYDIYFCGFDRLFNRPRANGGLSVKLVGTGFAICQSVLEQLGGWNTDTVAEDAEFSAQCALAGIRVWWAPEAVTYDEEPTGFFLSLRQRKRWCSGVIQVGCRMLPRLSCRTGNPLGLDMAMFLTSALIQPVSILLMAAGWLTTLLAGGGAMLPLALIGYYLGGVAAAAALQLLERPKGCRSWRAAAMFPVFMLSWMPLQVLALFHKTTVWREIAHTGQQADFA